MIFFTQNILLSYHYSQYYNYVFQIYVKYLLHGVWWVVLKNRGHRVLKSLKTNVTPDIALLERNKSTCILSHLYNAQVI